MDENANRKEINNLLAIFYHDEACLHSWDEMKICGNFQNLDMCGIHQWSYSVSVYHQE